MEYVLPGLELCLLGGGARNETTRLASDLVQNWNTHDFQTVKRKVAAIQETKRMVLMWRWD